MDVYFAPMEGLTDRIYRQVHRKYFPGVARYYMPFFSPTQHRELTPREARELPEAGLEDHLAVPQVLTKNAEDFLWAAEVCRSLGYREINLNLGCPSGTVVSKGKGSGMLGDPSRMEEFLDQVFSHTPIPVSVKTRLGLNDPEEFPRLLEIFNRYPISLLILHPRVRKDFYKGPVREEWFSYAAANSRNPLIYNGNLCSPGEIDDFAKKYPQAPAVMLGRGLIGDPGMISPGGTRRDLLQKYHDELLVRYLEAFGGSRNAMFRMKEHWSYLLCRFRGAEKLGKRLRKTTDIGEYRAITAEILETLPMEEALNPNWQPGFSPASAE